MNENNAIHAINASPDVRDHDHLIFKASNKMLSTNFPEFNLKNKSLPGVAMVTPNPMSNRLVKQKIEKKHPQATNELKRGGAVIYHRKKHFI